MKLIILLTALAFMGCGEICNCDYVVYDSNPTTNYQWRESYRSSWDTSCEDELIDESTYTDNQGDKWYSKTLIECS